MDPRKLSERLDAILVGGRERVSVRIVPYDPAWVGRFSSERERLRSTLGASALSIEHIGSTAVPGLAAKPIVDVMVVVSDPEDEALVGPLEQAGYVLRVREPGHRMFRTPQGDVHVHLWPDGPEVERHLRFRDRLCSSPEDRAAYERLKRELAERDWDDMNEYAEAKSGLIAQILERA